MVSRCNNTEVEDIKHGNHTNSGAKRVLYFFDKCSIGFTLLRLSYNKNLQLNHRIIISGLRDIHVSTRSQTTPQNYINVPSSHVVYSSIINLSFRLLYTVYLYFTISHALLF